jgi:hypothetical protein
LVNFEQRPCWFQAAPAPTCSGGGGDVSPSWATR